MTKFNVHVHVTFLQTFDGFFTDLLEIYWRRILSVLNSIVGRMSEHVYNLITPETFQKKGVA